MQTAIGQSLSSTPGRLAVANAVATVVVAADLALVLWSRYPDSMEGRWALALIALAVNFWFVQGDLASIGFRLTPKQGWCYWGWVALLLGVAVVACVAVGLGVWVLLGHELPVYATAPGEIGAALLRMCVFAPLLEETIYRLALCMPLAALFGPWTAIAVSGLAFGGLHVAYGNPSPENLVGGLFLAWAYLKSENIVVPVVLHGLGNLCALALQVGVWYCLGDAG